MNFRDLSLGTKQGLGFGLILLVLAGVSFYTIGQMDALRDEIDEVSDNWLPRAITISNLNLNVSALRIAQLQQALATDPTAAEELMETVMFDLVEAIDSNRTAYEALKADSTLMQLYTQEETALYDAFDHRWEQYQDQFFVLFTLYEEGRYDEAVALLQDDAATTFDAMSASLEALVRITRQNAAEAALRAEQTFSATRAVTVTLFAVTLLTAGLLAVWLVQLVRTPVRQLVRAARRIADGDLDVYLTVDSADELGTLSRSFNSMSQSLRHQQLALQASNVELEAQSKSLAHQKQEIERKNLELEEALHQLKTTQQQLLLKEKMASLGHLTAGIAHEIKNPLNFINNFAAMAVELVEELREACTTPAEAEAIIELLDDLTLSARKIAEHGKRADSIVRGMLQHAHTKPGERSLIDVNQLIEEYAHLAAHGFRSQHAVLTVQIEKRLDADVGRVEGIAQDLGRVLLNLIQNAIYAVLHKTQEGDGVFVPRVTVTSRRTPEGVCIAVQDNGDGIPSELRGRIFEPFFTTKPAGEGTGLGLSLSYEIVTKGYDGQLSVESEEGIGTTFTVVLPSPVVAA